MIEWIRTTKIVEGQEHIFWGASGSNEWLYNIEPVVKPKRLEPIGYVFSGWSSPSEGKSSERRRIHGTAKTVGECTAICEAHREFVRKT
jgi:hypothetical protein